MTDHGHHCPFLNRADRRCSNFFSLERLDHAFEYCFDAYAQCPVYLELLVERRVRRSMGRAVVSAERTDGVVPAAPLVQVTLHGRTGSSGSNSHNNAASPAPAAAGANRYVQHAA